MIGSPSYIIPSLLLAWPSWELRESFFALLQGNNYPHDQGEQRHRKHRDRFLIPGGDTVLYQLLGISTEHQHFAKETAQCIPSARPGWLSG